MKKSILGLGLCAALFTGTLFAKPVPQDELKSINAYLVSIDGFSDTDTLINKIELDENGTVTEIEADFWPLGFGISCKTVIAEDVSIACKTIADEPDSEENMFDFISKRLINNPLSYGSAIASIEANFKELGLYTTRSQVIITDIENIEIDVGATSVGGKGNKIKEFSAHITLGTSGIDGEVSGLFAGNDNFAAKTSKGLTQIINALRAQEEPDEDNAKDFYEVYETLKNWMKSFAEQHKMLEVFDKIVQNEGDDDDDLICKEIAAVQGELSYSLAYISVQPASSLDYYIKQTRDNCLDSEGKCSAADLSTLLEWNQCALEENLLEDLKSLRDEKDSRPLYNTIGGAGLMIKLNKPCPMLKDVSDSCSAALKVK